MTEQDIPYLIDNNAVFVMRGLPGSGKSTWVKNTFHGKLHSVYSADDYFTQLDGSYLFDASKLSKAHGDTLKRFAFGLTQYGSFSYNCPMIVDNTNLFSLDMAPYINLAQAYERKWCIVTMHTPFDVAFNRNTHGIDEATFRKKVDYFTNERLPKFWLSNHIEIWDVSGVRWIPTEKIAQPQG